MGVGFFCGLKICKEDFILTGDTFYAQHNFYDYELMSTLGLEKKDVTKMQALDGIAKARGSYSADALFLLTDKNGEADTCLLYTSRFLCNYFVRNDFRLLRFLIFVYSQGGFFMRDMPFL